jgi:hypothetical protein
MTVATNTLGPREDIESQMSAECKYQTFPRRSLDSIRQWGDQI